MTMGKTKGRKVTLKKEVFGFPAGMELPYLLRPEEAKKLVDSGRAYYSNKSGGKPRAKKPKHRMVEDPSNE
jgi:hypothetical protein